MKINSFLCLSLLCFALSCSEKSPSITHGEDSSTSQSSTKADYAIVIHGGAGTILKSNMTDEMEANYIKAMNAALDAGETILKNGGSAIDATN